jgi:lipoprotein
MTFDEKNLYYDFRLKKGSGAINAGNALWTLPTDRLGKLRDAKPDLGAYEYAE